MFAASPNNVDIYWYYIDIDIEIDIEIEKSKMITILLAGVYFLATRLLFYFFSRGWFSFFSVSDVLLLF